MTPQNGEYPKDLRLVYSLSVKITDNECCDCPKKVYDMENGRRE